MKKYILIFAVLILQSTPPFLCGQDSASSSPQLTEGQRQKWEKLPAEEKEAILNRYQRWKNLPPERKENLRTRWNQYQKRSPEEKRFLRERWKRYKSMSPEQKATIRDRWKKWQSLPPERKQELRQERIKRREMRHKETAAPGTVQSAPSRSRPARNPNLKRRISR